jgi:hypothetical protein
VAAGAGSGVAAAGIAALLGAPVARAQLEDSQDEAQTILNLAATVEALAVTAYYHAVRANPLGLGDADLRTLRLALSAEQYHLELLQAAGGDPIASAFYFPEAAFTDGAVCTSALTALETVALGAYLAAARRFAELGEARLAAQAAQHAASEAEHLAIVRLLGGVVPNPNGLPAPIYYSVSDAVPTLVPAIQGAPGFGDAIGLPPTDAVRMLAGSDAAARVPPFTKVF